MLSMVYSHYKSLIPSVREPTLDVRTDVCRRHILTYKTGPRAERVCCNHNVARPSRN